MSYEGRARWGIIGESSPMLDLRRMILRIAPADDNVLLYGESGVGKELVARAIHQEGSRSAQPFVVVNCPAIPKDLAESALFGHVRGSFTGADNHHEGYFAEANGGTILLDEIGEMSLNLQSKLLRVLEDRHVRSVGDERDTPIDVRVIAATNRNLVDAIAEQRFREDLYYRIAFFEVAIPPLRNRGDDILMIFLHYRDAYARKYQRPAPRLADAAANALLGYAWPGNVRELKRIAGRLVATHHNDAIRLKDLPEEIRTAEPGRAARDSCEIPLPTAALREVVAWHTERALEHFNGNKSRAAKSLRIRRHRLYRILDNVEINDAD